MDKVVYGGKHHNLQIEPTVVDRVDFSDPIMQEEIFGPVMPILTYSNLDVVIDKINSMPAPLALYIFTNNKQVSKKVTSEVSFGGGCINDVVIHLATSNMGFGGVGESGMGSYHGKRGFDTFSHTKSIVDKKRIIDLPMRYQPYTLYNECMEKKEKFEYDIDLGAIMDYVENRFMLVIKDEDWTQEEIEMLNSGIDLHFCYTNDIAIFVLEGGDIDNSDFYFNVQECDWKNHLFASDCLDVDIILLNKANEICFKKSKTLTKEQSQIIKDCLKQQNEVSFMPSEYDVNVQGIQSAYEPYELVRFEKCAIKL